MPTHKIQVLLLAAAVREVDSVSTESLLASDSRLHVTFETASSAQATAVAKRLHPDVVLLDGFAGSTSSVVAELDEALASIPVLVLLNSHEQNYIPACVGAGARGCLLRPFDSAALTAAIVQVHTRASRNRQRTTSNHGLLLAVRGTKGGVGTTAVATNLAIALHRQTKQPTVLVDGNFFAGDVPAALNLTTNRSVMDLLSNLSRLDDDVLTTTLAQHSSGIHVLAAPTEFEQVETIKADAYQRILEELRNRYAYVVVDCSVFMDESTLAALDLADLLLLVATPELASLKNATRVLQLGARLGYSERKLRLVVNRFNLPGAISPNDFEQHLAYRMSFKLPNDSAVSRSLASGEPLKSSSKVASALDQLARTVVSNEGWKDEGHQQRSWRPFGRRAAQAA
jgi:pilus assembly protein CpaE